MRDLPSGWITAPLSSIASVQLGRQRSPKNHNGPNMRPYLRAANVTWKGLALDDVKEMHFSPAEVETFRLRSGDILLAEASGSASEVGKPAIWRGEIRDCCFQNTLLRVRSASMAPHYLLWFFKWLALSGKFGGGSRGVGIHHLGAAGLSEWLIPVAPRLEQDRIVAAIEAQISKLDAAVSTLEGVRLNLKRMRAAVLAEQLALARGEHVVVREIAELIQYGYTAKAVLNPVGPKMLRITDIQDNAVRWSDVPYCEIDPQDVARFRLEPGDLVFARTGATVGKSFVIQNTPEAVFASYLIRLRFGPQVLPDFVGLFFQSQLYWRQIAAGSRGIGQPNVNAATLGRITMRMPARDAQQRFVDTVSTANVQIDRLESVLSIEVARSHRLRSSILAAAFSGDLVAQDVDDEPASDLLNHFAVDRASTNDHKPTGPRRRQTARSKVPA
jgi:type I restriction enzyme, S subunit